METSARLTSLTGKVLVCSAADRMSSEEVLVRTMKLTLKKRENISLKPFYSSSKSHD